MLKLCRSRSRYHIRRPGSIGKQKPFPHLLIKNLRPLSIQHSQRRLLRGEPFEIFRRRLVHSKNRVVIIDALAFQQNLAAADATGGIEQTNTRLNKALVSFINDTKGMIQLEYIQNLDKLSKLYLEMLDGNVNPKKGYIVKI